MSKLRITKNTIVVAHYQGTITETGEVFDRSIGKEPLVFLTGSQQMIPGFEKALMGKSAGEFVSFKLKAKDAYGEHKPEAIQNVPLSALPKGITVGSQISAMSPQGEISVVTVTKVNSDSAEVDMNHQLAGKNLSFEVDILATRKATTEEIKQQMVLDAPPEHECKGCCG